MKIQEIASAMNKANCTILIMRLTQAANDAEKNRDFIKACKLTVAAHEVQEVRDDK